MKRGSGEAGKRGSGEAAEPSGILRASWGAKGEGSRALHGDECITKKTGSCSDPTNTGRSRFIYLLIYLLSDLPSRLYAA